MSFILDAIKKSENERKRSKQADVHSLQDSAPRSVVQAGTGVRSLLLIIALAILVFAAWWLWPQIAGQLFTLQQSRPLISTPAESDQSSAQKPQVQVNANTPATQTTAVDGSANAYGVSKELRDDYLVDDALPPNNKIKELWELPADYQSTVPGMEFSFHVFSREPEKRTIIINGRRMRAGQMVAAGLKLRVITETGVILYYRGRFFHVDVIEKW